MNEDWLTRVESTGVFSDREAIARAVGATFEALGGCLVEDEAHALAPSLPPEAARALLDAPGGSDASLSAFYGRVAALLGVREGVAMEHAQVVCRAVAVDVPEEVRERLRRHVPELAVLLEVTPPERSPHVADVQKRPEAHHHNLAEGRPGSRHPISTARPGEGHAESIAQSDDPHGDTKLSSAHGTTQEREGETLATGDARAKRPISDT
jgi:uncharacterized protein (DUF2267 family)